MSYQHDRPDDPASPPSVTGRPVHPLEREPVPAPPPGETVTPPPGREVRRVALPTSKPIFTYVLLVVNILVFLADNVLAYTGNGYQGIGLLTLLGAKSNPEIIAGQYWRFITPMFLHGGILHIGFNSYFLYIVGRQIEQAYGHLRFLALYFVSGVAGALASFVFSPDALSIGASGALFGIIGAWIPLLYRNKDVLANTQRQIRNIVQVIAINLLIGLSPGIDNWAHLGGLTAGLLLGWVTAPRYAIRGQYTGDVRIADETSPGVVWLIIMAFSVLLVGLIYVAVMLQS